MESPLYDFSCIRQLDANDSLELLDYKAMDYVYWDKCDTL